MSSEQSREEERAELVRELREREKELNCLYGLSRLIVAPGITFDAICEGLVDLVPPAWQYPEVARAKLDFDDKIFTSGARAALKTEQSTEIIVHGDKRGTLSVGYTEERPEADKGPFLKEERALLDALAERLGRVKESMTAEQNVIEERERWERSFRAVGEGVFLIDKEFKIIQCNDAFAKLIGDETENIVGRKCHELVHRLDEPPEFCVTCLAIKEERSSKGELYEPSISKHIAVSADPSFDPDGNFEFAVHLIRDISDRKKAETALQEKNEELKGFAHTVSHDIKSPVATIGFAAQTLNVILSEPLDEENLERIREITAMITNSVEHVGVLVDDILALAEAGRTPTGVTDVAVNDIVGKIIEEHKWVLERKGVDVRIEPRLGRVMASPTHVHQVFANLITNSIRYNDNKEPTLEVSLLGIDESGAHRYLVRDNGPGIPEDDLERVFAPFHRVRGGGTGIGLATVSRIIGVYGGSIRAYNRYGACFEFTLKDYEK